MSELSIIKFSFEGGLAESHRLDFYEASRFQYGAARLIYTLDSFIENRKVLDRVTMKVANGKFRVAPPEEGSWELDVFQRVLEGAAAGVVATPIVFGLQYVYRLLFPARKRAQETIDILQSLGSGADVKEIDSFLSTYEAVNEDKLIAKEIATRLIELKKLRIQSLEFEKHMGGISFEEKERLIQKTRTQFNEIGYPLSKSADRLSIEDNTSTEAPSLNLSHRDIVGLSADTIENILSIFEVEIKSFDKETGWGKIRIFSDDGSNNIFSFMVKRRNLSSQRSEVLDAMKGKKINISGYRVITPSNTLKYFIFEEYIGPLNLIES